MFFEKNWYRERAMACWKETVFAYDNQESFMEEKFLN